MSLDWQVCSRARVTRDARFDGKFFIAVLTTGIYCRPICPSRTSKESNVRYYPTASAATEAGFRPCLRCRPECSPGTPAWLGTPNTVLRALKLIDEGSLEDEGVEVLAERLGVGSRHLRRLFLKHLGATPVAVAQTRRLQFAKKLIDETNLPMSQVAIAAGFGCVRRFNASIRKTYHRTPTEIRALSKQAVVQPDNQYVFHLPFRPPYDWKGMMAFLAAHAVPGVEVVEEETYRRSIFWNGCRGHFEVTLDARQEGLTVQVGFGDPRSLFFIVESIRSMFDLNADWVAIVQSLRGDPLLQARVDAEPGLRVPGCWSGFEIAVCAVLRQIKSDEANALVGRLIRAFGQPFTGPRGLTHLFPSPKSLSGADLIGIGVSDRQAETIHALAGAVCEGRLRFERSVDREVLLGQLAGIPRLDPTAAHYIAMRALGVPDAFPYAYLNLQRVLKVGNSFEIERRSLEWRPWRSYAAIYLWMISRSSETRPAPANFRDISSPGPSPHMPLH